MRPYRDGSHIQFNFYKHSVPTGTNLPGKWVTQRGRQDAKIINGPYFAKFKTDPDFLKKVEDLRKKIDAMLAKAREN